MSEAKQLVELGSPMGPVRIRLLNHQFDEVGVGYGKLEAKVKPGIYLAQTSAGGRENEEIITVHPGKPFRKTDLEASLTSVLPISGDDEIRRSHSFAVDGLCSELQLQLGQGSGLVIFVRNPCGPLHESFSMKGMEICDAAGTVLVDFGDAETGTGRQLIVNREEGWAGVSAKVNPGPYFLRWTDKRHSQWAKSGKSRASVVQPIWVGEGWTTVLFMVVHPDRHEPRMTGMNLLMGKFGYGLGLAGSGQRELAVVQEMALNGIRQGIGMVPTDFLNRMLNSKFQNPMAGVIGAHALLLKEQPNWRLFDTVITNLDHLIPDCPDVIALRMLGKIRRGQVARTRTHPIEMPPMMYRGYHGVIAREWNEGGVILPGSVAEDAAARLLPQGPWTIWRAEQAVAANTENLRSPIDVAPGLRSVLVNMGTELESDTKKWWRDEVSDVSALVSQSAGNQVEQVLGQIAASGIAPNTDMLVHQFQRSGVPMSSVKRVIDAMGDL